MVPHTNAARTDGGGGLDDARDATAVGLGLLFAALVAVSLWASAVAHVAQFAARPLGGHAPLVLVSAMASLVGLGGGALAYARYRAIDIGRSVPRRASWSSALVVVVAPAALALAVAAVGNALFGVTLSAMTSRWLGAELSMGTFLLTVVVPSAFLGVGYALLFCGFVYERARELLASGDAVAVAAMLAGFFWVLPVDPMGARLTVGDTFELLASLVFGVAFAAALGVVYGRGGPSLAGVESRHWVVLVVAALGVVGAATDLTDVRAVGELLWIAALALAVVGYAQTRSVWVAALSLAVFRITLLAVVSVESSLGLAIP